MEKNIIIDGDIRGRNYLTASYSIKSTDSNNVITIIERFYNNNDDDMYSYSERYKGENGVAVISCDSILGVDLTGNIAPAKSVLKVEYFSNDTLKKAKADKREAKADVSTSSKINLIPKYFSSSENIRFSVERKKKNGEVKDFTFAYPKDADFRQQLRNIFNSVVFVNKVEYGIISLACVEHDIMPEEVGVFDATRYVSSYSKKQIERKAQSQKQIIKK